MRIRGVVLGELLAATLHVREELASSEELEDQVEAASGLEREHELHQKRVLRKWECTCTHWINERPAIIFKCGIVEGEAASSLKIVGIYSIRMSEGCGRVEYER